MAGADKVRNVVLVGFMGSGKSTIGRRLAEMLGFRFVDTDSGVEETAGKTIPAIFDEEGEAGFRDREAAELEGVLERAGQVVSTGGGVVVREANRERLRREDVFCVWLTAGPDEILERVTGSDDRPLLRTPDPRATIVSMLAEREPFYGEVADLEVSTIGLSPDDVAYGVSESVKVAIHGGGG